MQEKIMQMWTSKLGLQSFDPNLFNELVVLMIETSVDYIILKKWSEWLEKWKSLVNATTPESRK